MNGLQSHLKIVKQVLAILATIEPEIKLWSVLRDTNSPKNLVFLHKAA
jgi:hypothetical protein